MATNKKKKRKPRPAGQDGFRSRWAALEPTPGDMVNEPDEEVDNHVNDLLVPVIAKAVRKNPSLLGAGAMSATLKNAQTVSESILERYHAMLTRLHGDYLYRLAGSHESKSWEELREADLIDASEIVMNADGSAPLSETAPGLRSYVADMVRTGSLLYTNIPCFESGILRMTGNLCVAFRITSLNIDQKTMETYLTAYEREPRTGRYNRSTEGTVWISVSQKNGFDAHMDYRYGDDAKDSLEILTRIPPSKLPWTKEEKQVWESVMIQNAVDQMARNAYRGNHALLNMARQFFSVICLSNYMMSRHRPVVAKDSVKKRQDSVPDMDAPPADTAKTPPERIARRVGALRIVSVGPPMPPDRKTVRNYVTASWSVRGFTRKCKSGKTVYVKPSIRRRRSLTGEGTVDVPVEIKLAGSAAPCDPPPEKGN